MARKRSRRPGPALRLRARRDCPTRRHVPSRSAANGSAEGEAEDDEGDNTELDEYNAYLAKLQQQVQGHGRWHGLR